MKQQNRKALSFFLSLVLLLSTMTSFVFADDDELEAHIGLKSYMKTTGETFTLEVFPKYGTEPYTYSWEFASSYTANDWTTFPQNDIYSGVSDKILTVSTAPSGLSLKVRCLVTDSTGKSVTAGESFITVRDSYEKPEIYYYGVVGAGQLSGNTYSLYKGSSIRLYCNAGTTGDIMFYQWQYSDGTTKTVNVLGGGTKEVDNWYTISGATDYALADGQLAASDEVKAVRCRITDTNGTVTGEAVNIQTIGSLRRVSDPADVTVRVGDTALFNAAFDGASSYKWAYIPKGGEAASYINSSFAATYGVTILGETDTTLAISNIKDTTLDGFRFYCCGYDSAGTVVTTKTATLTVKEADKAPTTDNQKPSGTQTEALPFTDIAENAWYINDVRAAYASGLINGKTATEYCPDEKMTIAEAIKLAACMHQQYFDGKVTLAATGSPWYRSYVDYAAENGITDKTYADYNRAITREEYVHIFFHALPQKEYVQFNMVNYGDIPDVKDTHGYALEIYTFYRAGILSGMDEYGSFEPESNIKRSEVAAILTRMTDDTARRSIVLKKK